MKRFRKTKFKKCKKQKVEEDQPSFDPNDIEVIERISFAIFDPPKSQPPVPVANLPLTTHKLSLQAILSYDYVVSKKGYKNEDFDLHREWLTVRPKDTTSKYGGVAPAPIFYFRENETMFGVPRYYGLARWGMVPPSLDRRNVGRPISGRFKGTLTPKQQEVCDLVLAQFRDPKKTPGGIIQCPCGFGKTVCALYIACNLGLKTLYLVRQEEHLDNAIEEAQQFLPENSIGRIHQNKMEIESADFCVAMEQTLLAREYPSSRFDDVGLLIVDEMHHVATPTFLKLRTMIGNARYALGLSATPRRSDGQDDALFWLMGPILISVKRNFERVSCTLIRYGRGDQTKGPENEMITRICSDVERTRHIVEHTLEDIFHPLPLPIPRKTMILSRRLHQLGWIKNPKNRKTGQYRFCQEEVEELRKKSVYAVFTERIHAIYGLADGFEVEIPHPYCTRIWVGYGENKKKVFSMGFLIGGMNKNQRNDAKNCQVIFAEDHVARENLNIRDLDTIRIISPMSDVEQPAGRVLRVYPYKNEPAIYYYADTFGMFEKQGWIVYNYFKSEGWDTKIIHLK